MANQNPDILDLDAVLPKRDIVVKLDGVAHTLVPISLEGYLENARQIKNLAAAETDLDKEFDIVLGMVNRAFPTIGVERLRQLQLPQLEAIAEFARNGGGSKEAQDSEKENAANPPQAE